jgi:hypothetical protein
MPTRVEASAMPTRVPTSASAGELAAVLGDLQAALNGVLEPMDTFLATWSEVRDDIAAVRDAYLQEDRQRFGEPPSDTARRGHT